MRAIIVLLSLLVVSSGYFLNNSFAEVSENQAFLLEGSGFAVTEEIIRVSEIDLGLSSQNQRGSTINFLAEDGFIILDDEEFIISNLEGKFLREGKYIRINGNIESSNGFDTSISFFGRLVDESKNASVYGFTGRITTLDDSYKVIYTTKLSSLSEIKVISNESQISNNLSIHILKDSSTRGIESDGVPGQQSSDPLRLRFFSQDRISVEPGTTITIINNDIVSHNIISGKENYGDRHNPFTPDGRISTGIIASGESISITFDDAGFYRLYSPDFPWMKIVAYVFPDSNNLTLGEGQNLGN
jgi:plastocyanin